MHVQVSWRLWTIVCCYSLRIDESIIVALSSFASQTGAFAERKLVFLPDPGPARDSKTPTSLLVGVPIGVPTLTPLRSANEAFRGAKRAICFCATLRSMYPFTGCWRLSASAVRDRHIFRLHAFTRRKPETGRKMSHPAACERLPVYSLQPLLKVVRGSFSVWSPRRRSGA